MAPEEVNPGALEERVRIFESILGLFRSNGILIDLGAGHGEFSIVACKNGWNVYAVDARSERFPVHWYPIKWITEDVRSYEIPPCNLICMLGLFYHLTLEDQICVLEKLRRANVPVILDTHMALHSENECGEYAGRTFIEKIDENTAAFRNTESFWHTRDSLIRILKNSGFFEIYFREPWYIKDRTFLICF